MPLSLIVLSPLWARSGSAAATTSAMPTKASAFDLARVTAVIDRIAGDVHELSWARRSQDLDTAAMLPDPRAERRRRLAEPDLEFRAFWTRRRLPASSTPATGASLGRLAGRALPARRDQPTARLHRRSVPATLTTAPVPSGQFRKLTTL